ncbi:MAG: FAD-dependent oxidoreductase [Alphaproteobacteria bacterium]
MRNVGGRVIVIGAGPAGLPYNAKIWGCDLSTIECKWTSERVAAPSGQTEKFSETGGVRKPLQSDTVVRYPREGGFDEIFKAIASSIDDIRLNCQVVAINPENRQLKTANGEILEWDRIVSTMPIDKLARMVRDIRHIKIEYGYPIQTIGTRDTVDALVEHLESLRISSIGRFSQWKYINSDACIKMGLGLAEQLSNAHLSSARG